MLENQPNDALKIITVCHGTLLSGTVGILWGFSCFKQRRKPKSVLLKCCIDYGNSCLRNERNSDASIGKIKAGQLAQQNPALQLFGNLVKVKFKEGRKENLCLSSVRVMIHFVFIAISY